MLILQSAQTIVDNNVFEPSKNILI